MAQRASLNVDLRILQFSQQYSSNFDAEIQPNYLEFLKFCLNLTNHIRNQSHIFTDATTKNNQGETSLFWLIEMLEFYQQ